MNDVMAVHPPEAGGGHLKRVEREKLRDKLIELCPEIEQLGIHPIVLSKGNKY